MAPLLMPAVLTEAPARLPLPGGVFSVISFRTGDHWSTGGMEWESETCDPVDIIGAPDCDTAPGLPKNLLTNGGGSGEASPFSVYGHYQCSPIGNSLEWAQAKARNHLLNREEQGVESVLWNGGATPWLDPAAATDLGTASDEEVALALLEQYSALMFGSLAVIHMSRFSASILASKNDIKMVGGRLYTALGTPVVAGSGYGDPTNTTFDMFVTPPLFGYRSEVFEPSSFPGDLLDTATNDLYGVAERSYVIGWEDCGFAVVHVPAPDTTPLTPVTLELLIGTIPSSPIPDGTDTTVNVQANSVPGDEVHLWYRINSVAWVDNGEMTQIAPTEFVENVNGGLTVAGDVVELYAQSGTTVSPTIIINIT
jgi:hypothetical protein